MAGWRGELVARIDGAVCEKRGENAGAAEREVGVGSSLDCCGRRALRASRGGVVVVTV
jgi:hypothetical protein